MLEKIKVKCLNLFFNFIVFCIFTPIILMIFGMMKFINFILKGRGYGRSNKSKKGEN